LNDAYVALARVPLFKGVRLETIKLERLGSLTNVTYKVTIDGEAYVLRLPGKDTFEYINRTTEEHNARLAATAGINAEVLYFDTKEGTMLSRFVDGVAMDGERFKRDPGAPARAALTLRRVHRLGRVFGSRFDVFAMIDNYLRILNKLRTPLPEDYYEVEWGAEAVRRALGMSPVPLVPCHNDPWPKNFVDAGERLYIVDWEFSGMNDPMWDLGDLSAEAGFGPEQDRVMMEAYYGDTAPPALYSRLELYKAMSDLLWALWGFIQHATDNQTDNFWAYALGRLGQCRARMGGADFGEHLNAVQAGQRTMQDASNRCGFSGYRPSKTDPDSRSVQREVAGGNTQIAVPTHEAEKP
jgi:thiamine kinase-like enzyme